MVALHSCAADSWSVGADVVLVRCAEHKAVYIVTLFVAGISWLRGGLGILDFIVICEI